MAAAPELALAQSSKPGEKKAPPQKSAAELALDAFNKARAERGKFDQAHFGRVINAGISYLVQFPTHSGANGVVRDLSGWAASAMRDKSQVPQRIAFISQLKYEIITARFKEGLGNDAKAALAALDASAVDAEAREIFNRQNLDAVREKIDTLTAMPGASRFLVDRERSYNQLLTLGISPARGEEHLNALLKHSDKGVAAMARQELNMVELRRDPIQLKFTALDGKEVDFAQLRGKIVAVYFWSTTSGSSTKNFDALKQVFGDNRRRGLEVITVSFDRAEDREKVAKFVKDNRIAWPVHFDGAGSKNAFATKWNVTGVPRLVVFDKQGLLVSNNLQINQLDSAVKKLNETPKKK